MHDPLTADERERFEALLIHEWRREYAKALTSHAFDPDRFGDASDHRIAKIAARRAGDRLCVLDDEGREAQANYSHF